MQWVRALMVAGVMGAVAMGALDAQARPQSPPPAAGGLSGTWQAPTPAGGTVTLVLTQAGQRITGTLSGNGAQFQVEAELGEDGGFYGTARGQGGALFIGGELQEGALGLALAELTADGMPDMRSAQELRMTRAAAGAVAAAPGSPGVPAGAGGAPGNAPAGGAAAAPSAGAGGGVAALGSTPQDQQIATLLLSSPWCWMSYSQISGTTRTERLAFRQDGRFTSGQQRESAQNNQYGSYYGSGSDGQQGFWKVQSSQLMLSADGQRFEALPLQITRNSNGYPIITANGREYYQCN